MIFFTYASDTLSVFAMFPAVNRSPFPAGMTCTPCYNVLKDVVPFPEHGKEETHVAAQLPRFSARKSDKVLRATILDARNPGGEFNESPGSDHCGDGSP
jgi:hypothetical protein